MRSPSARSPAGGKRKISTPRVTFVEDKEPRKLDADEVDELREAFQLFDEDGDGTINQEELGTVMRSLGQDVAGPQLQKIFQSIDVDGSGALNFQEFLTLVALYLPASCTGDEELLEAFKVFDKNNSGTLSIIELTATVHALGIDATPEQLQSMIACCDDDEDGLVQFQEFKRVWANDIQEPR
ncbi:hypothetical protein M885DRAFT_512803 [Pelagophyceae sp. CCMP2097]|nr:hypothetical protein M885DRAFT_512803 [Pelagophyceae sp. CCMP2097]